MWQVLLLKLDKKQHSVFIILYLSWEKNAVLNNNIITGSVFLEKTMLLCYSIINYK